jgi:manganese/zinc-transporting P-type ATPase C
MTRWFRSVEIAHALPSRVRLRYRRNPDTPGDEGILHRVAADLPGVTEVRINPAAHSAVLGFDPERTDAAGLCAAFAALLAPGEGAARTAEIGALATSLAVLLGTPLLPPGLRLPVSALAALPVLGGALAETRENPLSSHMLEALAVSISLARRDTFAANTTTFMLALGEHMENRIARRSDDLLKHLLRPAGDAVWVLRDGAEIQIAADEVEVGETVIVGAGAVVPVDGTVLTGAARINEATMTGESTSAEKARGDTVLSGTLVEDGRIAIYAEQVGANTATARIADYVEQALEAKSETQLAATRLADRLVPSVLGLAAASFVVSGDWRRAASVLQGDYSCALKLATPVAFKAAMYAAGQAGILVKGANALERLAEADTFVFDKTGTLTTGTLEVTEVVVCDEDYSEDDLICLAASVEEHYFHPLAAAVVAAAQEAGNRHFEHQEVEFIVAHGVASTIAGRRVVVGSRHFVEDDEGISIGAWRATADALFAEGKTLLYVGYDERLLGILAMRDQVRASAARTVARLRAAGAKRILMLTGDHRARAAELARELGLDDFRAELLPDDKARIVEELAASGTRVAFVGDGINDAPALAGAHVGIAMQKGADIARLTADIALLEDDLERVADAHATAVKAMRRITANHRLTVGLNTAILAAAGLGVLSPVATALLHNGTTIGILLNALRLRL